MSATKIIWHQVILVCLIAFTFVWAATEWTAYQLAFQPQLGPAWFSLGTWPLYQPFAFFIWWFEFDAYAPTIFLQGGRHCRERWDSGSRRSNDAFGLARA